MVVEFNNMEDESADVSGASESGETRREVIVLHPGSRWLRVGKGCTPHKFLHVLARRRRNTSFTRAECCNMLPKLVDLNDLEMATVGEHCERVSQTLMACNTSMGQPRYSAADHSRDCSSLECGINVGNYCDPNENQSYIVGDKCLYLSSGERTKWDIRWPIRRGRLDIRPDHSLTAVCEDLAVIWSSAITHCLGIAPSELSNYSVLLVIPDVYEHSHIKGIINVLFATMGFSHVLLHLESVCAAFSAGLGTCTVVDVGAQKTSVACVDDGMVIRSSRTLMEYGGDDITQLFYFLLKRVDFPYKECDPEKCPIDALLVDDIKEKFCHIDLDVCGVYERSFYVRKPNYPYKQLTIRLADECMMAPLGLFYVETMAVTGAKKTYVQALVTPSDPEDPHDDAYLLQTQRRGVGARGDAEAGGGGDDDVDGTGGGGQGPEDPPPSSVDPTQNGDANPAHFKRVYDHVVPIDEAILHSLERVAAEGCVDETRLKTLSTCVLVVGMGAQFAGFDRWLQQRLSVLLANLYRGEIIEIITKPKDVTAGDAAWRGASIVASADTAQEMWISAQEWKNSGPRILREKLPFQW